MALTTDHLKAYSDRLAEPLGRLAQSQHSGVCNKKQRLCKPLFSGWNLELAKGIEPPTG
jgi:hypothetical protein